MGQAQTSQSCLLDVVWQVGSTFGSCWHKGCSVWGAERVWGRETETWTDWGVAGLKVRRNDQGQEGGVPGNQ